MVQATQGLDRSGPQVAWYLMFCLVVCIAEVSICIGGVPVQPYIIWGDRVT